MILRPVGTLIDDSQVDHLNIQNAGSNTHAQIDAHIADASLHFTEASIDHTAIQNVGVNTHAQIDTHIADTDVHWSDAPADAQDYVRNNNAWVLLSAAIGTIDHGSLSGLLDDDHPQYHDGSLPFTGNLDVGGNDIVNVGDVDGVDVSALETSYNAHVADGSIHFTEASIDHTAIMNVGSNTHADIDTHIADSSIHFNDAPSDGNDYARNNGAWVIITPSGTLGGLSDVDLTGQQMWDLLFNVDGNNWNPTQGLLTWDTSTDQFNVTGEVAVARQAQEGVSITGDPGSTTFPAVSVRQVGDFVRRMAVWAPGVGEDFFLDADFTPAVGLQTLTFGSAAGDNLELRDDQRVRISGAYNLPTADGTANFVVSTDGSGNWGYTDPSTIGVTDHTLLTNIGVNTHAQIDTHIADSSVHFTEGSIDHANILNVGSNSHAAIDSHIADTSIHFADAPADAQDYVRNNNAWVVASAGVTDHTLLTNIGVNTHAQIDTHIADGSVHFTEASIDHTAILNVGSNTHAQIDSHIASTANPHGVTLQQAFDAGNIIDSTTAGIGVPDMTEAQRDLIAATAGEIIFNTDTGQLNQYTGAVWTVPGAGLTTLQGAYDNDPTGAQIMIDAVPNPIGIQATVPGEIFSAQDVGGTKIFEIDIDPDLVVARAGVTIDNAFLNGGSAASLILTDTFTTGGPYVGGGIQSLGEVTYNNAVFIWALLQESKTYLAGAGPGFAAFTLFNAIPTISNAGNFDLVQALVLNVGVNHQRRTAGTSNVIQTIGMSFAPQTSTTVAGAIMTRTTGMTAVNVSPTWSTVAGSTVNLGTVTGLNLNQPAQALFGSSAGIENITAYYGVNWNNMTFGGASATRSVIRSNQAAGTNTRFLDHTGTAESRLVGNLNMEADFPNGLIRFGASDDVALGWVGGTEEFFVQLVNPVTSQMRFHSPAADRIVMRHALQQGEFNFQCDRFSLGQQAGANGNQVGNFVTPARTIGVSGEWADFLLTQGGSLTVDGNNMSRVSAWVINGISYASSSGTVTDADTLTVGGFPTSAPGVTITNRHSLNVIAGRSRFASSMQFPPITPAALAAGNNNDWAGLLTGSPNNNMRHWARISGNATTSVLTGINADEAQDGETFELTNVSSNSIDIAHQSGSSAASNRIITPSGATYQLGPDETVIIRYDATDTRWRLLSGTGA